MPERAKMFERFSSVGFLSLSFFPVSRKERETSSTLRCWSEAHWNNLIVLNLITGTSLWQSETLPVCGCL